MKELLIELVGAPLGTIVFQLIFAAQYTLSVAHRVRRRWNSCGLRHFGEDRTLQTGSIGRYRVHLVVPVYALAHAFVSLWARFPSPVSIPDISLDRGLVALTIFTSAYLAEVWRGAIGAVGTGQWEASNALNLRYVVMLRRIIIPQAVKFGLAPTIGFLVQIIKGTSLAYIIGFHDLMLIGKRWANAPVDGSEPFVVYPIMAVLYFCLCYPLALFARQLEQKALARGQ